ncbi:bifunctional DNA primase/polymerase [Actinospica durhamensis]|uniref:Bifunctional DNA primase/polymerase n=1 Tax=Actinospica durhamensis TaxID=1508375 RepID=A0A941ERA9_9ACTN|nr:bifunctional DNA primase/polymerase [Actinospica durhamensis]MBR7836552.1 bifunctional DNA primase/polymerase [Actinospica durhamensis]
MTASVTPFDLAARGFALFPLRPDSKLPAVSRDWEHAATTSPLRLRRLCADPRANYAVACGPSNLVVLDLDVAKEPETGDGPRHGWQVLLELADGRELPRTFTVGTPSGGRHLYFRPPVDGPTPRNTVRRLGPLIDTRGVGGYVVAPGSRIHGVPYRVLDDAPIAELPEWIGTLLLAAEPRQAADGPLPLASAMGSLRERLSGAYARSALEREVARVEAARVGTRNDTLNRAAYNLGTLIGVGLLDQTQVEAELTRASLAVGLDARETASTLRSGLTAGIARPRVLPAGGARPAGASDSADGEQLDLLDEPPAPPRPPRIGDARETGAVPVRAAAAARLADTAPLADPTSRRTAPPEPVTVLIPAQEPELAQWPRLFGAHVRLGRVAAAVRRELREAVPRLTMPQLPEPWTEEQLGSASAELMTALAALDVAYDHGACAARPLVTAVRWHLIRTLADLLRDLHDELADTTVGYAVDPETAPSPARARREQPLSPHAFALVRALCSAAGLRISALAKELTTQLALEGQRRSPLWNAVRRLQREAERVSVLCLGDTPSRYAAARTELESQLTAMRRESHAA